MSTTFTECLDRLRFVARYIFARGPAVAAPAGSGPWAMTPTATIAAIATFATLRVRLIRGSSSLGVRAEQVRAPLHHSIDLRRTFLEGASSDPGTCIDTASAR